MNIVIANQYNMLLKDIGIPTQEYRGLYDVNELGNSLQNIEYQRIIIDVTAIKGYQQVSTIKQLTNYIRSNSMILFLDDNCINDDYLNGLVSIGVYNFAKDIEGIKYLINNQNNYNDVAGFQKKQSINEYSSDKLPSSTKQRHSKVIGFVNVTRHAGATTLVYTLVKALKKKYNVIGIEVDSTDFSFFRNNLLISTIGNKIRYLVNKYDDQDVILIDTNGSTKAIEICDEMIYLVEPTTIKINKMILAKPSVFQELFDKKVVLNKSPLDKWEIAEFENEARIKTFYNLPIINERSKNDNNIVSFLKKLGFKI